MTAPLALSSWSAVSPFGIGAEAFIEGITSGRGGLSRRAPDEPSLPTGLNGGVPGLGIRQVLGLKNTRTMDRITALAVLTVGKLLDGERECGAPVDPDGTGLVLGTTAGSVQSMMEFTRDSFTRDRPYLVDPARFPNGVMNCAAGQSAIWHGLRGPNATVAAGQVAGLSALSYAARLHRFGHARSVLCGAVEELSRQRTWLESRRGKGGAGPLGEGCAIFRLESAEDAQAQGRTVAAHLLATAFRVCSDTAAIPGTLAQCATSVLRAASASSDDVWLVAADLIGDQHAGLRAVVGTRPRWVGLVSALGDTGAASGALQVAAVLSHAATDPAAAGRLALVASVDRDGLAGVAALAVADGSGG